MWIIILVLLAPVVLSSAVLIQWACQWKSGKVQERQILADLQQLEKYAREYVAQLTPFRPERYGTKWLKDSDWEPVRLYVEDALKQAASKNPQKRWILWPSKALQARLQEIRHFLNDAEKRIELSNQAWWTHYRQYLEQLFFQLTLDIQAQDNQYIRESVRCRLADRISGFLEKVERLPSPILSGENLVMLWRKQAEAWGNEFSREAMDKRNEAFVLAEAKRYDLLFDAAEKQPLTDEQRKACVTNEDRNLLLAGAGTGKTSTMAGRALYLVKSGMAKGNEILMLAFGKNAAEEMQARLSADCRRLRKRQAWGNAPKDGSGILASTFHSLGLSILRDCGMPHNVPTWIGDESQFNDVLNHILDNHWVLRIFLELWTREPDRYREAFDFKDIKAYNNYLKEFEFRTIQGEVVKSYEECVVANCLFRYGIQYRYEESYPPGPPPTSKWKQYKPDFHLLEKDVWLEHFAISHNQQGKEVSPFGRWYVDAANKKRAWHKDNQTHLLETTSEQYRSNQLEEMLKRQLLECGYSLKEKSEKELLQALGKVLKASKLAENTHSIINRFKAMGGKSFLATVPVPSFHIRRLLDLLERIFDAYEKQLQVDGGIDFEDMIQQATPLVREGRWQNPYKQILVDEFQDISRSRADLLMALLEQRPDCVLFAVGDDWQAIYGFTGSDSKMTTDFRAHFARERIGYQPMQLTQTFRFGNGMCKISSSFVTANPEQSQRCLCSIQQGVEPLLVDLGTRQPGETSGHMVSRALNWLKGHGHEAESILVLGRTNSVLPSKQEKRALNDSWTGNIDCKTAHKSKGLEADNVIILNASLGKDGFPNIYHSQSNVWEPLEKWLDWTQARESFPDAEERRLFYVALTRARKRVFLDRGLAPEAKSFSDEVMSLAQEFSNSRSMSRNMIAEKVATDDANEVL